MDLEVIKTRQPQCPRRLRLLLLVGILTISAGLAVRLAPWMRERWLAGLRLTDLARLAKDAPGDAPVLYYYGEALRRSGKASEAAAILQRAVDVEPRSGRAYTGLGTTLAMLSRVPEAERALRRAQSLAPRDPEPLVALARLYSGIDRPDLAAAELQAALSLQPRRAEIWYTLARIYLSRFDRGHALDALQKAVTLDGRQSEYWRELGQVYGLYSRLEEGEQCLRRALALCPDDAIAWLWLGQTCILQEDTPENRRRAEEALRACLRLARRDPLRADPHLEGDAHFAMGKLLRRAGRCEEAENSLRAAIRLNPALEQAFFLLGQVLLARGKRQEGQRCIDAFQQLSAANRTLTNLLNRVKADPKNPELHLRLARLYRRFENVEGTINEYRHYLSSHPNDSAVARELERYRRTVARRERGSPGAKSVKYP